MNQLATAISNPDPYYLESVTEFSIANDVVSSEDIYSQSGIKLVAQGTRLDKSFYQRLVKHKLATQPIDRSLTVKDAVTPHSLARDAARLLDEEPQLTRMANALPDALLLRHTLAQIPLNSTLAFKLTLARETRPALYRHSIRIALISLYLGACVHLKPDDMIALAAAAIFHDLGELHIAPALLDPARRLDARERRHIYAHPMIVHLILREYPEYHPAVSHAVLEHHERLDGSGYPRNLKGAKISPLGQILAVAELAGSVSGNAPEGNAYAQVEVILKLNSSQFRGDLVGHLSALARQHPAPAGAPARADLPRMRAGLENIARILADWNQAYAPYREAKPPEYLVYVYDRIASLEKSLFDAGFNPAELDRITDNIEEDPQCLAELAILVREAEWQMKDALFEIKRRWPELETAADPAALALRAWISQTEQLL